MLSRNFSRFRLTRRMSRWAIPTALLLFTGNAPLHAETLKEALTAAYLYNPILKAAQAQLRATDNSVAQAKSGYRPTITASYQEGWEQLHTKMAGFAVPGGGAGSIPVCSGIGGPLNGCNSSIPLSTLFGSQVANGPSNPRMGQVALQETLFDGFRTYNNIKGAEALVEATREDLRGAEINVLLNAATAYMNVVRDSAIVKLRENAVKVLAEQLRATEDRFKVGEVTRTDVAQAQSGLAASQADLSIAQGTLYGDQALFGQYIGHPPGALRDPGPPNKHLPKSLQAAIDTGQAEESWNSGRHLPRTRPAASGQGRERPASAEPVHERKLQQGRAAVRGAERRLGG